MTTTTTPTLETFTGIPLCPDWCDRADCSFDKLSDGAGLVRTHDHCFGEHTRIVAEDRAVPGQSVTRRAPRVLVSLSDLSDLTVPEARALAAEVVAAADFADRLTA